MPPATPGPGLLPLLELLAGLLLAGLLLAGFSDELLAGAEEIDDELLSIEVLDATFDETAVLPLALLLLVLDELEPPETLELLELLEPLELLEKLVLPEMTEPLTPLGPFEVVALAQPVSMTAANVDAISAFNVSFLFIDFSFDPRPIDLRIIK